MRRAVKGVERVFHVAGTTNLRLSAEQSCGSTPRARARSSTSACRRRERVVHVSSVAAIGPARRAARSTSATSTPARWGSRTPTPSTQRRSRRCASPHGLDVVSPARARPRARRRAPLVHRGRAPLPAAPHPRLRRRRRSASSTSRTSRPACCCATRRAPPASATSSGRATTPGSGCSASCAALRRRGPGRASCRSGRAGAGRGVRPRARADAHHPGRGPRRGALVDVPLGEGARELGWTTRPHEETVEADRALPPGAAGRPAAAHRTGSRSGWRVVGRAVKLLP